MDLDISKQIKKRRSLKQIKKWRSEIGQELDGFIKKELSKYDIDEEHGLERVEVKDLCENDLLRIYPESFPELTRLSDWYIDGKLAFALFRKVKIENPGVDFIKNNDNFFKVVPNGKASVYSCKMTIQYFIGRFDIYGE